MLYIRIYQLPYAPESNECVLENCFIRITVCVFVLQIHGSPEAEGRYGGTGGVFTEGPGEFGRGNSQEHSYPGGESQFERTSRQVRDSLSTKHTPFSVENMQEAEVKDSC